MFSVASIIGNLGQTPEVRYAASGTAIVNLSIAVSEHTKDANGNSEKRTHWFKAVCFGRTAEIAGQYLHKGSRVGVSGTLVTKEWVDQGGNKRSNVEIRVNQLELLSTKAEDQGTSAATHQQQNQSSPPPHTEAPPDYGDEQIPF